LKDIAYKAMQVKEELTNKSKREPTVIEIANQLGLPKEKVVMALEAIVEPMSLYEPVYSEGGDTIYVMDQVSDEGGEDSWIGEIILKEAIKNLNEREKAILNLRFFRGRTQVEAAQEIGISQAQISRLEKNALDKIKSELI
ncbi:MAG: sigma-70 family RNA polymerase sigma factor, partial [Oscillospiraceae bacterium]